VRCLRRFLVGAELDTWELLVGIAKELRKEIAIGQQQKPPSRVTSGWKSANVVFMLVKHEKNPRNEAASVIALYWRERMKLKRWRARPNEMLKTLEEILLRSISANLSESERQEISMAYKGTQRSYTRELAGVTYKSVQNAGELADLTRRGMTSCAGVATRASLQNAGELTDLTRRVMNRAGAAASAATRASVQNAGELTDMTRRSMAPGLQEVSETVVSSSAMKV